MTNSLGAELLTMKSEEYLYDQMELEGIQVSGRNLITRIHPEVEDFPLVLLANFNNGEKTIYFDDMLPPASYKKIVASDLKLLDLEAIAEEFSINGIKTKVSSFIVYTFPENYFDIETENVKCLQRDDPKVVEFGFGGLGEKVFALEYEGKIISACVSSRENEKAAESWVYTAPEHRGKRLALQVVRAWASSVLRDDKIPFYSHAAENIASAKVAEKLRLVHLFTETVFEQV